MIIYKTINLTNDKIYIGKDKYNNPKYMGSGKILRLAFDKYGLHNFKKEILEYCKTEEELNTREKCWIKKLGSQNKEIGYNITSGGKGGDTFSNQITSVKDSIRQKCKTFLGKKHTEESKKKMSKNNAKYWLGKIQSKSLIEKRSKSLKGRKSSRKGVILKEGTKEKISKNNAKYWLGKKHSQKTKNKLSNKLSGKNHPQYGKSRSEETKEKIRKGNQNKIVSDNTRKKLREINIGKKHTEETKRKMSLAQRKRRDNENFC